MNNLKKMQLEFENDLLENGFIEDELSKQNLDMHKKYLAEARLLDKIEKQKEKPVSKLLKIRPDTDARIKLIAEKNEISYTQLVNILIDNSLEVLQTK